MVEKMWKLGVPQPLPRGLILHPEPVCWLPVVCLEHRLLMTGLQLFLSTEAVLTWSPILLASLMVTCGPCTRSIDGRWRRTGWKWVSTRRKLCQSSKPRAAPLPTKSHPRLSCCLSCPERVHTVLPTCHPALIQALSCVSLSRWHEVPGGPLPSSSGGCSKQTA